MKEKKFIKLTPFKMQVLQSFPFIDEDFDAITNYELLCKVVEYLNKTVENVDLLNEKVEEFQKYFDNLDVQEEINNKLDEMALSGELTEIIAQYLQLAGILAYNNLNDLKNATNITDGSFTKTYGKVSYNDGYGEFYKIRALNNTDVIDDDNLISLNNYPLLVAEKIVSKTNKMIINAFNQNKFKPDVYASMYMIDDNEDTIKARILKWKEMGCKGVITLINLNNDSTLSVRDDLTKVKNLMNYAKDNGLIVNTIKFHCNLGSNITTSILDVYENRVNSVLTTLNALSFGINRLTIFNELPYIYSYQATSEIKNKAISIINNLKQNYTVGISCSNLELGIGNMIEYSSELCDAVDYFAFNYYQNFPFKKELTNKEDSMIAWSKSLNSLYTYKQLYNKNIIFSETGCLNNWLNMMDPSNYNLNEYPANGKTYPIYFYGLLNNQVANTCLSELWLWYDEVMTNYDDVIEFFKYYLGGE